MATQFSKHTLNLRPGDVEFLQTMAEGSAVTASVVIRLVIARYVDNLKARVESEGGAVSLEEISLNV